MSIGSIQWPKDALNIIYDSLHTALFQDGEQKSCFCQPGGGCTHNGYFCGRVILQLWTMTSSADISMLSGSVLHVAISSAGGTINNFKYILIETARNVNIFQFQRDAPCKCTHLHPL